MVGDRRREDVPGKNPIESHFRAEWAGDWKPSPWGGVAGATLGGGALADPLWSLVRQAQGPFSREGEEVQGSWGLLAPGWPGASRVLGPKESRLLGLLEVGWEATKPQQDSGSAGPLPSPPALA